MAQFTVRDVNEQVLRALKRCAAGHGRSAEADHQLILCSVLMEGESGFFEHAKALRRRVDDTPRAHLHLPDRLVQPWELT